ANRFARYGNSHTE
ncbi:hypothetical protein EC890511_2271, partial [Escherichia coli 89.0511]